MHGLKFHFSVKMNHFLLLSNWRTKRTRSILKVVDHDFYMHGLVAMMIFIFMVWCTTSTHSVAASDRREPPHTFSRLLYATHTRGPRDLRVPRILILSVDDDFDVTHSHPIGPFLFVQKMGNIILNIPPPASSRRYVIVITGKNKFGTSLRLLESEQTDVDVEENRVLPFSFEGGPISTDDFFGKLEELRAILAQWKGGLYSLILSTYSIFILVSATAAHVTPQFWTSSYFYDTSYMLILVVFILILLIWLIITVRSELRSLTDGVEDLYRPWRACGVRVSMMQVATLGKYQEIHGQQDNQAPLCGCTKNYFCVIMDINRDDEADDDGSVATAQTMEIEADSIHDTDSVLDDGRAD
jgi:hypothetical protein